MVKSQKIHRQPTVSARTPLMIGPKLGAVFVKRMTVPVKDPLSATGEISETTPCAAPKAPDKESM
jgi:hypothetical protein